MPAKRGKRGAAKRGDQRTSGGSAASAQHHERRKRLVSARESTLRDLGGLMLEMYKRNRFREELLLDKCEEVLAIEVEIAHVDQRLFQLAPPTSSGQRPIGRCECGVPILPGQNFCGVCGRSFGTLTQARTCSACGTGLRTSDAYCPTCGTSSPSLLEAGSAVGGDLAVEAAAVATRAADTMIVNVPLDPDMTPPPLIDTQGPPPPSEGDAAPGMITSLLDDDDPPPLVPGKTAAGPAITPIPSSAPMQPKIAQAAPVQSAPLQQANPTTTETAIDVAVATATPNTGSTPGAAVEVPAGRAARKEAKRRMKAADAARRQRARVAKARARAKMEQSKRDGPQS